MAWVEETHNIVEFAIVAVFGFGIALWLGDTLYTAMPANSVAANAVNSIIGGFNSSIGSVLVPIISVIFVLFMYLIVKHTGLLGGKKKKR
jgi:heme/copper-type cytochrome/quinol oxidase subunit 2